MACPASCAPSDLVENPTTCVPTTRRRTFSRFIFFACNTTLPTVMPGNIKPLFDDGSIVSSSSLVFPNGLPDPNFEEVIYDECTPAQQVPASRVIDFEDRIAISTSTGSPAVVNEYFNYLFWRDKMANRFSLSYGIVYCNGDVYIPKDSNDVPYTASLNAYLSYQKPQANGGGWIEFIKGQLAFQNDPLDLANNPVPDFNLNTEGIII